MVSRESALALYRVALGADSSVDEARTAELRGEREPGAGESEADRVRDGGTGR
jgi:hypothetical protein